MKIFVAIPVYDGKMFVQGVRCLLDEQIEALKNGDEIQFMFLPSCSHPAMGRNQLAQEFLNSDCEKLFFLDADITFDVGALLRVAKKPVDVVGGAYRLKMNAENYPVGWLEKDELWSDELGLIEVNSLPGGFLCISRDAFKKFQDFHGDRTFEHFGHKSYCFFQMCWSHGRLNGEDSFFCHEFREAGGKVYLYPELNLTHWDGTKEFKGHIGNWLKSRIQ